MDFLAKLQMGNDKINKIKSQLFDVVKVPLVTNLQGFEDPNSFAVYKSTGGKSFGTVGDVYTPTQPKMLFEQFENCLYSTDADFNKIKYLELKGGKKIVFEVPIKTMGFINKAGKYDENIIKLNVSTGYDGKTKSSMFLSVYREICSNGMKGWRTEFNIEIKNTIGNAGKIGSLCNHVSKAMDKMEDFEEILKVLNSTQVNSKQTDEFVLNLLGYNEKVLSDLKATQKRKLEEVYNSIELEFSRTGSTLWGLVNGVTYYTNHIAQTDNTKDEFILAGVGLDLNNEAQRLALTMV